MKILVIAAHPDDEVLGCGGTIARYVSNGANVHVAFMTDGVSSRSDDKNDIVDQDRRRKAAEQACAILGMKSVDYHQFPDNGMDTVPLLSIVKEIEKLINVYQPDTIFTHYAGDLNIDHQLVNRAVITATRPQPEMPVKTVLSFEIPSSTEWQFANESGQFVPNWFIDISDYMDIKLKALNAYHEELREWPHPRSIRAIEHLAHWRGAIIGKNAAEAFILNRHIEWM